MATFVTTSGYTLTLDSDGISAIVKNGVTIASGTKVLLWDTDVLFSGGTQVETVIAQKTGFSESASVFVVVHEYTAPYRAQVVYRYTLSGDDVRCDAQVHNLDTRTFTRPAFGGPAMLTDTAGLYYPTSSTTDGAFILGGELQRIADHGEDPPEWSMYPSYGSVVAGAYWKNTTSGEPWYITQWVEHEVFRESCISYNSRWSAFGKAAVVLVGIEILPQETRHVHWAWRFTATDSLTDRFASYKTYVRGRSPLQYDIDARPWWQWVFSDPGSVTATNPYGYHGGDSPIGVRFDTLAGIYNFYNQTFAFSISGAVDSGAQGVIFWSPQGVNPRGQNYRPDFWIWPPPYDDPGHAAYTHELTDPLTSAGLKAAFQSRTGARALPFNWATDFSISQPNSAYELNYFHDLWVTVMGGLGFSRDGYNDSCVNRPEEHAVVAYLRGRQGRGPQWYTEQSTIASRPYAAIYGTVDWDSGGAEWVFASGTPRYSLQNWIYDDSCQLGTLGTTPQFPMTPTQMESFLTFCGDRHIVPMIQTINGYAYDSNWITALANYCTAYVHPTSHAWLTTTPAVPWL